MRYLSAIILWAVLIGVPQLALGQTEEELQRFEAKVSQGQTLFDAEEFDEAIEVLTEAEAIFEHPTLSIRIAMATAQVGQCGPAERRLRSLRRSDLPTELETRMAELDTLVRRCVSTGTVTADCSPSLAQVDVANRFFDCGEQIELEVGSYQTTITQEGFEPSTVDFTIIEGEDQFVSVELQPREEPGMDFPFREVGLGSMGGGAAMIGLGLLIDSSASGRKDDIEAAAASGDAQTVSELESVAQTRRRQTIGFVGVGAVALSAGIAMYIVGEHTDEPEDSGRFVVLPGPTRLDVRFQW